MRTTISPRFLDSLHPNEQVYMYFNIKRVEKVVLRRKKAKMAKRTVSLASKCAYTCADLPRFSANFHTCAQLYHPDLWIVYIPMNRSTCILTLKKSKKSCYCAKRQKWAKRTVSLASKCAYTCADLPRFSANFHTCAQLYHPIFG